MRRYDWMVAVALAVVGATAVVAGWPLDFWPAELGPGAGFLPVSLGATLTVLCIGIAVAEFRTAGKADPEPRRFAKPFRAAVLFMAYIATLEFLGFLISTVLFVGSYLWWVEDRRIRTMIVTSVTVGVCVHLLFSELLNVQLPRGAIEWNY